MSDKNLSETLIKKLEEEIKEIVNGSITIHISENKPVKIEVKKTKKIQ